MNHSLNQYFIFYTVAQSGNFTNAAKKLFISQPAISKSISSLEKELNAKLFYRSARGVTLTESGQLLYNQLEIAFHAIENGEKQLQRNEEIGAGHLSIGVSTTLCKYVLLPYLQKFVKQYPHITLSIHCQPSHDTIRELNNATLDIGLIGEAAHMEALHFISYQNIQDIFVCSPEYLKQYQNSYEKRNLKSLLKETTLLLLDQNNYSRQYLEKYLEQEQLSCERILEVSTMDLLIDFAASGLGIACVIRDFVQKELEGGSLVVIATEEPIPSRQIGIAYSASGPFSYAMKTFLEGLDISLPDSSHFE